MEYRELKEESIREQIVGEIRNLEAQHSTRSRDILKFDALLANLKGGGFDGLDKRVLTQRDEQWTIERQSARADVVSAITVLRTLYAELDALDAAAAVDSEKEE